MSTAPQLTARDTNLIAIAFMSVKDDTAIQVRRDFLSSHHETLLVLPILSPSTPQIPLVTSQNFLRHLTSVVVAFGEDFFP